MPPIPAYSKAIPLVHAGFTATIYILLREWSFLPWLWPLDDAVWLVMGMAIVAGWRWLFRREGLVARGVIVGVLAGLGVAVLMAVLFTVGLTFWAQHTPLGVDNGLVWGLIQGVVLLAWFLILFKLGLAGVAGGLASGVLARVSSRLRDGVRQAAAFFLLALAAAVPLAATASHAALGVGVLDIGRCRDRLAKGDALPGLASLKSKSIFVGSRADCFGQQNKGSPPRPG